MIDVQANRDGSKIHRFSDSTVKKLCDRYKDVSTVLVGGCFDLLHYGHLTFLERAKEKGQILIVALEPDTTIEKNKKRKPIHSQMQRARILSSLAIVDVVLLLPTFTNYDEYLHLVEMVKPTIIAVTEGDPRIHEKRKQAERVGAKVAIVLPRLQGKSSSKILKYENIFSD
ncbi:MAG: adenylyltransferase/cytidyltransferase family protein [bacterium]|nr:adenylyltransferase/cytidyltransferase family protein [bacterium]